MSSEALKGYDPSGPVKRIELISTAKRLWVFVDDPDAFESTDRDELSRAAAGGRRFNVTVSTLKGCSTILIYERSSRKIVNRSNRSADQSDPYQFYDHHCYRGRQPQPSS